MENENNNFINIINLPNETSDNEDVFTSDFESLLNELNKQVSTADGSVSELMRRKDIIEKERRDLEEKNQAFKEERVKFDNLMKDEYQKLNDEKSRFEQEKNRVYNDIQEMREELSRKNRDFEKYRSEQLDILKDSKAALANNYKQFEKIVATFNKKIDKFE
ncbi:MAG: hypothetical protein IKR74_00875 [Bacilli bacterium]|nr:hypothetical protein [Bacilli bacterium]